MYKHHIDSMINNVVIGLMKRFHYLDVPNTRECVDKIVRQSIEKEWKDKIAIIWDVEDVQGRAKECYNKKISHKNAKIILDDILDHHDAENGVTWITIDWGIEELLNI